MRILKIVEFKIPEIRNSWRYSGEILEGIFEPFLGEIECELPDEIPQGIFKKGIRLVNIDEMFLKTLRISEIALKNLVVSLVSFLKKIAEVSKHDYKEG